ncbi:hypothetical protein [Flavobacterium gelidilacus]|nr:hypothetical protein [Flavobacterium gelidilacus]
MEWYEIVILVPVVILGIYIRGRIYDNKNNYHRGNDWKNKKKNRF